MYCAAGVCMFAALVWPMVAFLAVVSIPFIILLAIGVSCFFVAKELSDERHTDG